MIFRITTFFGEFLLVLSGWKGEGQQVENSMASRKFGGIRMEQAYKTKEVSELLGVNPTTVQRWVKYFNLHCQMNEQGHYVFLAPHVEVLKDIHSQLKAGKKMKEITIQKPEIVGNQKTDMVPRHVYLHKFEDMMEKIEAVESKLSQKADDVVSYQLLSHRSELDEMSKMIKNIELRLEDIEMKLKQRAATKIEGDELVNGKERKRSFMKIFSI